MDKVTLLSLFQSPSIAVVFSGFRQSAIDPDEDAKRDEGAKTWNNCQEFQDHGIVEIA